MAILCSICFKTRRASFIKGVSHRIENVSGLFGAKAQSRSTRRFDVVLAESLDRFSRDQEDTAGLFKRLTFAGGLYAYATESFGPIVGGIAGTLLWVANSVVPSAAVANLLVDTLAMTSSAFSGGALRVVVLTTVYTLLAVVNIRGARPGVRLSMALVVIKIAPLVLLVAVGLFAVRASNLQWVGAPTAANIGQTAMLLFFAFMGTEGALTASGEVVNPARTVPRAILLP